jgi:hypothetical protein
MKKALVILATLTFPIWVLPVLCIAVGIDFYCALRDILGVEE